jgi:hypothetical protein
MPFPLAMLAAIGKTKLYREDIVRRGDDAPLFDLAVAYDQQVGV